MIKILQGDCRNVLKTLPDESVHCVVTSPPYWGLRDYGTGTWEGGKADCDHRLRDGTSIKTSTLEGGKKTVGHAQEGFKDQCPRCGAKRIDNQLGLEPTYQNFVNAMVDVFGEIRRVLRDDGTLWINLGDSYATGTSTGRKPTTTAEHGYWENPNISQRINGANDGLKPKDLVGIPWRVAFALQADGWYLRQDIIWSKPNPMPESVTDRCTKSHEYIFLLSKNEKYYYDADAIKEEAIAKNDELSNDTFLDPTHTTITKIKTPDGWDTSVGTGGHGTIFRKGREKGRIREIDASTIHGNKPGRSDGGAACNKPNQTLRNKRSVWTIPSSPFSQAHFATFPPKLIEPCIRAGCPVGGTVLDPFGGAGTTGIVADMHGRNAILIELNPEYVAMAEKRIKSADPFFVEIERG